MNGWERPPEYDDPPEDNQEIEAAELAVRGQIHEWRRSIQIRAVLCLICVSRPDGNVCGHSARYEHAEPEEAIGMARGAGWSFRRNAARCPDCVRRGASFGKVEG